MKKYLLVLSIVFFMSSLPFGMHSTYAQNPNQKQPEKMVQLTEQQKAELSKLYQEMFNKKKEIIAKKVEFGMISKEKGDKIISKMDAHFDMLQKNNFMFQWDKAKKRHFHHHE